MKHLLIAVFSITAGLFFASCQFFTSKQADSQNPLLGKWKIDSIATRDDSTAFGYLLLALSINDSAAYHYHFDKDSVLFFGKGDYPSKASYKYNDSKKQLIITNGASDIYSVQKANDSVTLLHSIDSAIIFLKKR